MFSWQRIDDLYHYSTMEKVLFHDDHFVKELH